MAKCDSCGRGCAGSIKSEWYRFFGWELNEYEVRHWKYVALAIALKEKPPVPKIAVADGGEMSRAAHAQEEMQRDAARDGNTDEVILLHDGTKGSPTPRLTDRDRGIPGINDTSANGKTGTARTPELPGPLPEKRALSAVSVDRNRGQGQEHESAPSDLKPLVSDNEDHLKKLSNSEEPKSMKKKHTTLVLLLKIFLIILTLGKKGINTENQFLSNLDKFFKITWLEKGLNLYYQSELDLAHVSQCLHELTQYRPLFTMWLMLVHTIVMITTLSVYNFAPYQWGVSTQEAFVQKSSLALEAVSKNMTGSVWGGPDLESLVLLGAMYAPCMRRDRQLYAAIEADWKNEADNSGCCVRRDGSGCYQVLSSSDCPATYADFVYMYNDSATNTSVRAVCGTSPHTCINPNRILNPAWNSADISNWPICLEAVNVTTPSYLSCELTGRPCCVGLQAKCLITTTEHCTFLGGRYHSEAFLCSQVDCMSPVCGLLPFVVKDHPDQVYRLFLSLFIHAGFLHLMLTLAFDVLVLGVIELKLGLRLTSFIYIFSGIGGNIISAVFVPYQPQAGPGASIFGIVAYIFVFVLAEFPRWERPRRALPILTIVLMFFLMLGVLLPFLDTFAQIGGFVFGFALSWVVLPMKSKANEEPIIMEPAAAPDNDNEQSKSKDVVKPSEEFIEFYHSRDKCKKVMMAVSMVTTPAIFAVFLTWLYAGQDNFYGFMYLTCIPYTSTFCLDYGVSLESRNFY